MRSFIKWQPLEDIDTFFAEQKMGLDLGVNLIEEEDKLIVEMAVPGIDPKKMDIFVEDNELTLSGSREEKLEKKGRHYHQKEILFGKFERQISLPTAVDPSKAKAECKEGVLRVVMPKKEPKKVNKTKVILS